MPSRFDLTIGTREADEQGPAAVAIQIVQGCFQFVGFLTAEDARSAGAALQDAANVVDMETTRAAVDRAEASWDVEMRAASKHKCPHCGAEDNYRCCEFGRDKL